MRRPPGTGKTPNSPCKGLALYRDKGIYFIYLHYSASSAWPPEEVELRKSQAKSEAYWNREMEVDSSALDGAQVYPDYDPVIHDIHPNDIPDELCCYMGIDPHPRTPHAALWVGVDRYERKYVYRELWPSKLRGVIRKLGSDERDNDFLIREYVEAIAYFEGNQIKWHNSHLGESQEYGEYMDGSGEKIVRRYMDQAGKAFSVQGEGKRIESYADKYKRYGISCADPVKAHDVGIDAIKDALAIRKYGDGTSNPGLFISTDCLELRAEFPNHRYRSSNEKLPQDESQKEAEFRTHMLDILRYILTSRSVAFYPGMQSKIRRR